MAQQMSDLERLKNLENGEKFDRIFSDEEYANRNGKLRD